MSREFIASTIFFFGSHCEIYFLFLYILQNERNPIIVPELADYEDCEIKFSNNSLYKDSGYVRSKTVDQILALENEAVRKGYDSLGFCAVVGPKDANVHSGLSVVTQHWDIPQLAFSTTDHLLGNSDLYPNFVRVIPDAADAAVRYVQKFTINECSFMAHAFSP